MIHSTIEEIRIILYIIGYGIFIISTYDFLMLLIEKKNKVLKIILSVIYCLFTIYFTYEFTYALAKGYMPIYCILFIGIGFTIYFSIRKIYIQNLEIIFKILGKIIKKVLKIIIFSVYPKEIVNIMKRIILAINQTVKRFVNEIKIKNKKRNNKLSK